MSEDEKRVLQQQEKKSEDQSLATQQENDKQSAIKNAAPKCGTCKLFAKSSGLKPSCNCIGGGGGSGGSGSSGDDGSKNEAKQTMSVSAKPFGEMDANITGDTVVNQYGSLITTDKAIPFQQDGYEIKFNLTFIAQLLANNDLTIDNVKQNGCLTISMKPNSFLQMSPEERMELKEFINFIEQQFKDFKNNLDDPKNPNKCVCKVDNDPNNLTSSPSIQITISDPKLYDEFIKHLASSLNKLLTANNAMSLKLITTHLQDPSKVTNEMKENAKSEHQDFLDQIKNSSPKTQNEGRKSKIGMTPFQTELTRDRRGLKKKYSEDK